MPGKFIKSRKFQTIVDIIHVTICIAIIVLAGFVLWKPLEHEFFYPFIFLLAAILNFVSALAKFGGTRQGRNRFLPIFIQILLGIILLIITFLSVISIWRA